MRKPGKKKSKKRAAIAEEVGHFAVAHRNVVHVEFRTELIRDSGVVCRKKMRWRRSHRRPHRLR